MTGISVLFNMNTEEACYIYGNMESYRRANQEAIKERYSAGLDARHRNYGDTRYAPASDLSLYTPQYSDTVPRYRSYYGYTDSIREPYYSSLNTGLYGDGVTMSRYTRNNDITSRNYEPVTTRSYESPSRIPAYDHGTPRPAAVDRAMTDLTRPLEFGTSYGGSTTTDRSTELGTRLGHASKGSDSDLATPEVGRSADLGTSYGSGRVFERTTPTRSPGRTFSLNDHDLASTKQENEPQPPPVELASRRFARQRINSGDSVSSQSSEKSTERASSRSSERADDRSLFKAYQNRYRETAEKEDGTTARPFSSWRRSGQFDNDSRPKSQYDNTELPQYTATNGDSGHTEHSVGLLKKDSNHVARPLVRSRTDSSSSQESKSDELMTSFRKAFHRHALSEEKHSSDETPTLREKHRKGSEEKEVTTDDILEKIRAARAHIKERDARRAGEMKSEMELERPMSSSSVEDKSDREMHNKSSTKLARQKLVSDDLKAKYMESRKDEMTKKDTGQSAEKVREESLSKKRSSRKSKYKEHMQYWSKPEIPEEPETVSKVDPEVKVEPSVPTATEMLHGSAHPDIHKHTDISSTSVFGVSYGDPDSKKKIVPSSKDTKHLEKGIEERSKHKKEDNQSLDSKKSSRAYQKYGKTKAKTAELGLLSRESETQSSAQVTSHDALSMPPAITMDDMSEMTRKERIERYKEERKKQLATISHQFEGGKAELPSLFLSSKSAADDDSPLSRSRSLKMESDSKADVSTISRSKSLKTDSSEGHGPSSGQIPKMSGLKLAELGSNLPVDDTEERHNKDHVMSRLQALKQLRAKHLQQSGMTLEELQGKPLSNKLEHGAKSHETEPTMNRTRLAEKTYMDEQEKARKTSSERDAMSVRDHKRIFTEKSHSTVKHSLDLGTSYGVQSKHAEPKLEQNSIQCDETTSHPKTLPNKDIIKDQMRERKTDKTEHAAKVYAGAKHNQRELGSRHFELGTTYDVKAKNAETEMEGKSPKTIPNKDIIKDQIRERKPSLEKDSELTKDKTEHAAKLYTGAKHNQRELGSRHFELGTTYDVKTKHAKSELEGKSHVRKEELVDSHVSNLHKHESEPTIPMISVADKAHIKVQSRERKPSSERESNVVRDVTPTSDRSYTGVKTNLKELGSRHFKLGTTYNAKDMQAESKVREKTPVIDNMLKEVPKPDNRAIEPSISKTDLPMGSDVKDHVRDKKPSAERDTKSVRRFELGTSYSVKSKESDINMVDSLQGKQTDKSNIPKGINLVTSFGRKDTDSVHILENETDSGRDSVDSASRIRRRLPSVEDVLGGNLVGSGKSDKIVIKSKVAMATDFDTSKDVDKHEPNTVTDTVDRDRHRRDKSSSVESDRSSKVSVKELSDMFKSNIKPAGRFELGTAFSKDSSVTDAKVAETPKLRVSSESQVKNIEKQEIKSSERVPSFSEDTVFSDERTERPHHNLSQLESSSQTRSLSDSAAKIVGDSAPAIHAPKLEAGDPRAAKPPTSPRAERKTKSEMKFGKVSYRSGAAEGSSHGFDFGTSFSPTIKREASPVIQREATKVLTPVPSKEKSPTPEIKSKQGVTKISFRDKEKLQSEKASKLETPQFKVVDSVESKVKSSTPQTVSSDAPQMKTSDIPVTVTEVPKKFDIKARAISTASGQNVEMPTSPTSPRIKSPTRVVQSQVKEESKVPISVHSVSNKTEEQKSSDLLTSVKLYKVPNREEEVKPSELIERKQEVKMDDHKKHVSKPVVFVQNKNEENRLSKTLTKPVKLINVPNKQEEMKPSEIIEKKSKAYSHSKLEKVPDKKPSEVLIKPQSKAQKLESKKETEPPKTSDNKVVASSKEPLRHTSSVSFERQISDPALPASSAISVTPSPVVKLPLTHAITTQQKPHHEITQATVPKTEKHLIKEEIVKPEISKAAESEKKVLIPTKTIAQTAEPVKTIDKANKTVQAKQVKHVETEQAAKHETGELRRKKSDKVKKIPKSDKPVIRKLKMDKFILDTSLDDILNKNKEYLSDLEPPKFSRGRVTDKPARPLSVHEPERTPSSRRRFRKKIIPRSKSEDRSHFKGLVDSDEDKEVKRSQDTEDIGRSKNKATLQSTHPASRGGQASVQQRKPVQHGTVAEAKVFPKPTEAKIVSAGLTKPDKSTNLAKVADLLDQAVKQTDSILSSQSQTGLQTVDTTVTQSGSREVTGSVLESERPSRIDKETGNQSAQFSAIRNSSPSMTEMLYGDSARFKPIETPQQSAEIQSGITSDASDRSERRRFISRHVDSSRDAKDSEGSKISDSDQGSVSSAMSEGSRRRRIDKTSLRKSKLNESAEDVDVSPRRRDGSADAPRTNKLGVRRVASSRLSREDKPRPNDEASVTPNKHDDPKLTKHGTSRTSKYTNNQSTDSSKPLSNSESTDATKSLTNSDQSGHSKVVQSSVLNTHSVLPSRFALPSKVSTAISKLSDASDKTKDSTPIGKLPEESSSSRTFRRVNNFSQLLQKFSSSDASGSEKEKSDTDSHSPRTRKLLKRQEAHAISSGSSDDSGTRKLPERTQSLRLRGSPITVAEKAVSPVQRSASFKSDFMKRRFSPEPEGRRRLPATPTRQSDKPTPELADVLSKRSEIVTMRQKEGEVKEREKIHDGQIEKADRHSAAGVDSVIADSEVAKLLKSRSHIVTKQQKDAANVELERIHDGKTEQSNRKSAAGVDEVIADSEVLQMLKSRRTETDSSSNAVSEKENLSQIVDTESLKHDTNVSHSIGSVSKPDKSSEKSEIESSEKSSKSTGAVRRLSSQSSFESKASIFVASKTKDSKEIPVSSHGKSQSDSGKSKPSVPKHDASIDSSAAVLETVTHDISNTDLKTRKAGTIHHAVTDVNVVSPSEIVQCIKSDETRNLTSENTRSDKQMDNKLNVDIIKTKVKKESESDKVPHDKVPPHDKIARDKVPQGEEAIKPVVQSKSETHETYFSRQRRKAEAAEASGSPKRSASPSSSSGTIDITSKSDILKKFTRDRTPERHSPKRSIPMKVMSPGQGNLTSSTASLTRTESVGRSESERPKGILKRTPSLNKTGVNVDPELASILKTRRQCHEETEEEDGLGKLTAQEEIQQHREAQSSATDDAQGPAKVVSVAERIFQMHNKIEESKSCPITPRIWSEIASPKGTIRSGNLSPGNQGSFEEDKTSAVSGTQLMERLSNLEDKQASIVNKRKKFQSGRKREDWRTRTQPVTLQEIQVADSLETVRKFRSEVLKKSSLNMFENLQKQDKFPDKKTEFPQHFHLEKRSRGQRHKTLPVTADELNAVPEDQMVASMNSLKKKFDAFGVRDSKADSGILSGSDGEYLERDSDRLDESISEDDPIKLSVSAKASMFHQIQEQLKESKEKKSASGAKRYIDRKKRERSRTVPITEDEVKTAAEFADNDTQDKAAPKAETGADGEEEGQGDADELSRISLADKVKLFTTIEEKKDLPAKKPPAPPPKRRNRKLASRFATQPVTYEEVSKAAKISPLACSLVKPPDPDILQGFSVKYQRELMVQHGQQCLSQPSSRSASQTNLSGSTELSGKDNLRNSSETFTTEQKSVSKSHEHLYNHEQEVKSIHKHGDPELTDALKPSEISKGVLKSDESIVSGLDSKKKSILKSELEAKLSKHFLPGDMSSRKGLLKLETESVQTMSEETVIEVESSSITATEPPKGILKKDTSFDTVITDLRRSAILKQHETRDSEDSQQQDSDGVDQYAGLLSDSSLDNLDSDEGILDEPGADGTPRRKSSRRFRDKNAEKERYRTQPAEVTPDNRDVDSPARRKMKYTSRHMTQPITPDEKREAEISTEMPEIKKTGSITDRLNALKKSGDEEWKKRVSKPSDLETITTPETTPKVKMREKKDIHSLPRPSSIADRLTRLDTAQVGWKGRVGETDAKQFTIEHKLTSKGQNATESPLVTRLRKKEALARDSDSSDASELTSPVTPTKDSPKIPLSMEVVCTDIPIEALEESKPSPLATAKSVEEEEKVPTNVEVANIGSELDTFFLPQASAGDEQSLKLSVDDFNELFMETNDMLEAARKIKPKRRHAAKSRNPLKTMSACLEVKSEYTEVITGVAERELKRVKTAEISQGSGFAVEALAGLASNENFAKIELRKTDNKAPPAGKSRLDPYLPIMLIHVKGRRRVQCRLVEPSATSLNSGDCFVLITPDKIIQWLGDYCNVIEKAKAADVADTVKQKRDLGCKRAMGVTTLEERRSLLGSKQFWDLLGGLKDYMGGGPPEEDELYENHILGTNMVYKLERNKLVPCQECWGNQPKYEMLQKDKVFVFDFGSEVYLWQGKAVTPAQRKVALRLAQQVWDRGYDYSSCDINPLCPLKSEEDGGLSLKCDSRPDWALFGKVNQNMETILFREKFADWPDTSRLIQCKNPDEVREGKSDFADLKPYDATLLVPVSTVVVDLVLEGSHVGRGNKWEKDMDGFMKVQNIDTVKVVVWHVLEYEHFQVESHSFGQFHEGDTYVIRWQYMFTSAGARNLKGQASKHSHQGRERCAYFFWQGKGSTINEKGASALMTVELDEERGPQIRVDEGKEPPCFLNLFSGRMIIHTGKREEEDTNTQGPWRFYCLRNEYENEMCLIEVPTECDSLRSVSSFVLLNVKTGCLTVWHGCKSPEHTRKLAVKAAENLKERCPLEVGLHSGVSISITEVNEGQEKTNFWRAVNVRIGDRSSYNSLLNNPESFSHTLRLFHMTSVSGVFEAQEILNPSRSSDLHTKFPILQTDLYNQSQPAVLLVDNGHEVYLWLGWWPEGDDDQENVLTGSAQTRFTADRKCAMETTLHYCKEINPDNPPSAWVVYAGLEPLSFTNLFPFWTVDEVAMDSNLREGKTEAEPVPVEELLKKVTKTRFPLSELLEIPPPEGVDPLKLESYLSDEEFELVLEMTREEFYALPSWKQSKVKQQVGLF